MKFQHHFTDPTTPPFDTTDYERRDCIIRNADGSSVFEMRDIEVPKAWSQLASDILISKYVRKRGVGGETDHENSIRDVVGRVAHTIRAAGEELGDYFDAPEDAEALEADLSWLLLHQRAAFNSPVWFNCGLWQAYGIVSSGGSWHWDDAAGEPLELTNNYEHPQCSACFIQSLDDDLMSIFQLVKDEARIFKYGSGTGTNFSNLRGRQETLSGGGTSSGLMSFLEVFDRAAGATKSGGTTRRAAKMACLDADHPEIRDFVNWKRNEEKKVRALISQGYAADFNGEAYHTISGQNSNNSVRVSDEFMRACQDDTDWSTIRRLGGGVCETFPARDLMDDISQSAWECADPGLQFETTINDWHTCPNSGPIRASNPCSEFMFMDDTACNLASINLLKYVRPDGSFDIEGFKHTIGVLILAQDILVDFSSYPRRDIARNSHLFRPLGLGYANLGALLMVNGLPYDSDGGRALAGAITAIMTGHAYRVSAEIAATKGAFAEYERNAEPMGRVIRMHRAAVDDIVAADCPPELLEAARCAWDEAIEAGDKWGYRNAQVSVLAPTGTIGLLMDCDTTGVEPDYSLVKFKKLSGGGFFKIVNQSVGRALRCLGYNDEQIGEIQDYVLGTQTLTDTPHINAESLAERGLSPESIEQIETALSGAYELDHAFSPHQLGAEAMADIGFEPKDWDKPDFRLLDALNFTPNEIEAAALVICGTMTIEGAPHMDPAHYAVFDCANKCGKLGQRFIQPLGHIRMMAAVQPFISGAISKTINLPNSATPAEIEGIFRTSWESQLKAVALYRDGSKSSQPLNSGTETDEDKEEDSLTESGQLEMFPDLADGPRRRFLPKRRGGITIESRIAGHKVFLRTGEYEDGDLGEVFIDMHKEGSTFRSLMMCFAIAVSKGLQYGVPLREFVDTFTFTNFEPRGVTDHPNIKMSTSVIDYVFRVLGMEYLGRTDFCQVKPDFDGEEDISPIAAGKGTPSSPRKRSSATPVEPLGESREDLDQLKDPTAPLAQGKKDPLLAKEGSRPSPHSANASNPSRPIDAPSPIDKQLAEFMGDAPFCDICGHITVRNGACYKCLSCGNSMGCS